MIYQRNGFKVGDRVKVSRYLNKGKGTIEKIKGNKAYICFDNKNLHYTYYYFNELEKLNESEEK